MYLFVPLTVQAFHVGVTGLPEHLGVRNIDVTRLISGLFVFGGP